MLKFNYKKGVGPWKIYGESEGLVATFSGDFNINRINNERLVGILGKTLSFCLWILILLATLSLGWETVIAAKLRTFSIFFEHNPYNLIFWIGTFAALYEWARLKQKELDEKAVNIFELGGKKKSTVDIYKLFNSEAKNIWNTAFLLASAHKQQTVNGIDIFLSLLQNSNIKMAFMRLGVRSMDIETFLENFLKLKQPVDDSEVCEKLPFVAFAEAVNLHNKSIDPYMLLCALVRTLPENHIIQDIFFNLDVSLEDLEILTTWLFNVNLLVDDLHLFKQLAKSKSDNEINTGLTSVPTPYLDHFSSDLTSQAKRGTLPIALGRGADLHNLFGLLEQENGNVVIKGPEGTGRTTLVNELAFKMASEQVPPSLQDKRLVRLELSAIVGNANKAEMVLINCLNEAASSGNIILVLEDLHAVAKIQSSQGLTLLEVLVDFLSEVNIRAIATTTIEDYTEYLQKSANFERIFTSYELQQLSRSQNLLACCIKASLLESQYKCFFEYKAIEQAYELTNVYIKNTNQPQKTINVLVEAATEVKGKSNKYTAVTKEIIQAVISRKTHIPTENFSEGEAQKLLNLETEIGKYVIGQDQAVKATAEGLRRARSGLASGNRPLASFLFLGPTGVGKTELAKTLANVYFGKEEYLLRLDMSEYSGSDAVTKIIGNQTSKTDTILINHLKNYPFCLLLLDEFEKASSEVHNLFLQILDDGRLTTGAGKTLDLTNVLIIATSNAGTLDIQEGLEAHKTIDQIKAELFNTQLLKIFRPELLNRFDGVIVFTPLSEKEIEKITYLQLEYLRQQLRNKGIKLEFTEAVIADIGKNAYNPLLGARPIRRYIQDHLEGFIAKLILSKQLSRGSNMQIDLQNGDLVLK
jgi:ATP-dependent Clp protease ATP-binding subunit ClpC